MIECKKPNCDCADKESERLGTECIKSYPCLVEQNNREWAEKANTFTTDFANKIKELKGETAQKIFIIVWLEAQDVNSLITGVYATEELANAAHAELLKDASDDWWEIVEKDICKS